MKFEIEVRETKDFGTQYSIKGPGIEYIQDDEGRGMNPSGLGFTNDDEYVMSECDYIISCMKNIIRICGRIKRD